MDCLPGMPNSACMFSVGGEHFFFGVTPARLVSSFKFEEESPLFWSSVFLRRT